MGEWLGADSQRTDLEELILAEYGGAAWVDEVATGELVLAYVRRKRFEARLIAAEVGWLFSKQEEAEVHPSQMLAMFGVA